ncbi:hypothetical protein J2T09_002356 [Neorhizobium huautlense]|uniref:Uncharacterized protein n=1 Tax=Neorhizobium huautlense TaxID=67774 RepID=A0ABT9PUQ8_9HYPH|nr:hypothetical protein [Neorhizobium huautlense]MDP9837604.1 hypothetical protein [Neorhizobium huautlense]
MSRLLIFAAALAATPAVAAEIEIEVQNFTSKNGIARATMLVKNTSNETIRDVYIDCAFLGRDKRAVGIGKANIRNLPARGDAYTDASLVTNDDIKFVDCRGIDGSR